MRKINRSITLIYKLIPTTAFKKDFKLLSRRKYDLEKLTVILELLKNDLPIPEQYHDHPLTGNYKNFRELHISSDWLLIYLKNSTSLIITLSRTGTHSDLFKK